MRPCFLALLALAACQSPEPCSESDCLDVAGSYRESGQGGSADCGDGNHLTFTPDNLDQTLSQSGSALTLEGSPPLAGTLHADGSAVLGPVPAVATPDQGSSGGPQPGKLWLEGFFTATGFAGTFLFVADNDGCEVVSRVKWTR